MSIRIQHSRRLVIIIFAAVFCVASLCVGIALSSLKSPGTPKIKVFRETQALELVAMEATTNGSLRVVFKNVSGRDINGFVVAISGGPEVTVDTSTGDRVIAPQATEDLLIPARSEVPEITIRAVMFADGNVEGNEITVAQVKQRRGALKRELKRGLALIRDAADSPDADSPAVFENLESAISNLAIDPTSQTSHDTGLIEAKQDLVAAIRDVRTRQERNSYLKQRERLQELCHRIERRIATL
jgi:hypothetical protein